ncbi:MAG: DNA polymerase III subunit alpha [Mycoplasmatales bacterium]|nr:DNA polymerase III subunit alpha [Mycoplasmatales bacterium]
MKITPLHVNTEYSFQESTIRIDALIKKAKKHGLESLVITDHNSMFGVSEFIHKAKKANLKPVIGLDLDVENFRVILLAKNHQGYILLNELSSKKIRKIDIKKEEINSPNIFVIDHPSLGHYAMTGNNLKMENYFVGTTNENIANGVYVQEGKILEEKEKESIQLLNDMVTKGMDLSNIEPLLFETQSNSPIMDQAAEIVRQCNIVWPENNYPVPKYKNSQGISSIEFLKSILKENANKKLATVPNKMEYVKRIEYEVSIIEKLGFEDYFLIIWDLVTWSKKNQISIGPGRGSAAGSIVAFLLDITEINPIEYGLLFERFLNPERISMPDIDIDIQDTKRDEVIKYLFNKYGNDNVALISTFSRLGAKSAIRDVARHMGIPVRDVNAISKLIPSDNNLQDAYKNVARFRALIDSSDQYSKLFRLSALIEGLPRQFSTHAAGIVISDKPILLKAPTVEGPEGYNQIQYSMDYLEEHGILKIDLLGLRNLTIIQRIQEEIYKNEKKTVNLHEIPLDDKETLDILSKGDTNGIFQFESYGMKKTLEDVGVSSFNDVSAILSLFRPGPMDNIPLYANIKNGYKRRELVSDEFDRITDDTYGIIVYQEQIMEIAQVYSGMSFGQADILRRAIGKKNHSLIESLKTIFINGGIKNNHKKEEVERIYKLIEKFADYGFNKSHAVAYSMLSYRMAYLKAKYKFEFYTALLEASIASQATVKKYVEEAKRREVKIIPPNINRSEKNVINKDSQIILPLQLIKGFGDAAASKILSVREENKFNDLFDFVTRARISGIGESTIQLLINANALRDFGNMQTLSDSLPSALRYSKMVTYSEDGENKIDYSIISKPKLIEQPTNISDEIFNEKKLFGFQMNAFLTSQYELKTKLLDINDETSSDVVILVEKIRSFLTKTGETMAVATVSDSSSVIELMIFNNIYKIVENTKARTIVKAKIECKIRNKKRTYILKKAWKEMENG